MQRLFVHCRRLLERLPPQVDFGLFIVRRLRDGHCLEAAGSLTFATLVALIPLLTIALTVVSAFPMFDSISARFKMFLLSNLVPDSAGKVITIYMRQFTDNADRLTAVGMLTLAVTALAMMSTIDQTFNRIWRVRRGRSLVAQTLGYWAALTLLPLLLAISLALTTWLADSGALLATLLGGSTFVLALSGLYLLYKAVPNCPVPRHHALAAALFTTVALSLMKALFGWYVQKFGTFKLVYGAFASFPIFLLWLYLVWTLVLAGAVVSAALSYWRGEAWRRRGHPGRRVEDAVRLLLLLDEARRAGLAPTVDSLRRQLVLGLDELHELLSLLSEQRWVQPTRYDGWVLASALERISLGAVYRLLLQLPSANTLAPDVLGRLMAERYGKVDLALEVSLAELARANVPAEAAKAAAEAV